MYTNDSQAISAVLGGDKSSYESLIEKHKQMVYGIAWSHLGDSDLSEDAAQETFIKAYTYLGTLREPEKFAGWLARIARNVCNSLGRKAKRDKAFKERWAVLESAETEPRMDERESISEPLWSSFADLPAIQREALAAFYIEGKSVAEAAIALGITEQAMRTRLSRARTALREQLEQRLEESLGELKPSKSFTRSVLALLPLSPKGIAAGSGLAIFGKLFASLSFAIWMAAAATLPIAGLYSLMSRTDESSISDAPEYQPIKAMIRRDYRIVIIAGFAGFALSWLLMRHIGPMDAFKWICVMCGCVTIIAIGGMLARHRVGSNTPASVGNVAGYGIMFLMTMAISFFHVSIVPLFPVAVLAMGILNCFVTPKTPHALQRIGTNPFLRRAFGRGEVPEANLTLDHTLSKLELRAFVRLLGTLGIPRDYRFRGDTISMMLTGVKPHRFAGLGLVAGDSEITISPDGACAARISESDLKAGRGIVGPDIAAEELEADACRAIRYALSCFARGDAQAGLDSLSVTTEGPGRVWSQSSARNQWVKALVTVWMGIVCVVEFTAPTAVLMIVAGVVGFAVAGLALAINLYITRRQARSL